MEADVAFVTCPIVPERQSYLMSIFSFYNGCHIDSQNRQKPLADSGINDQGARIVSCTSAHVSGGDYWKCGRTFCSSGHCHRKQLRGEIFIQKAVSPCPSLKNLKKYFRILIIFSYFLFLT